MKCIQNEGRRMDGNARGQNEYGNVNRLVINKWKICLLINKNAKEEFYYLILYDNFICF